MSDARRGPEDDPLVHSDGLLVFVLLDGDVTSKEEQGEWRHFGAVVQEDLRRHMELRGEEEWGFNLEQVWDQWSEAASQSHDLDLLQLGCDVDTNIFGFCIFRHHFLSVLKWQQTVGWLLTAIGFFLQIQCCVSEHQLFSLLFVPVCERVTLHRFLPGWT